MAPRLGQTREHILDTAYQLFYEHGFVRASLDAIAARANVTKRTLYYHFESKDRLLAEVLEHQSGMALRRIAEWAGRLEGDATGFVERYFAEIAAWSSRKRWEGPGYTRLVMELADLPGHPARAVASRHKAAVESHLAVEFARRGEPQRAGELARILAVLAEGAMALTLVHGGTGYIEAAAQAMRLVLSAGPSPRLSEGS